MILPLSLKMRLNLIATGLPLISAVNWSHTQQVESNEITSNVAFELFEQRLDHYDALERRTFSQRFVKARTNAKGPMFVYLGGESPLGLKCVDGMIKTMAEEFDASIYCLEHRFYGESQPEWASDFKTEDLKWLTTHQAIGDLQRFIEANKRDADQEVIVFGCSYPGSLAAWSRLKLPGLIQGAISSSAPLDATAAFTDFDKIVAGSVPSECQKDIVSLVDYHEKVYTAFTAEELKAQAKADGCHKLAGFLERHEGDATALDMAKQSMLHVFAENVLAPVQYNDPSNNAKTNKLCATAAQMRDPAQQHEAMLAIMRDPDYAPCDDQNMLTMYAGMPKEWDFYRNWNWQSCAAMGFWQTTTDDTPDSQRARARGLTLDYYAYICDETFTLPHGQHWNLTEVTADWNTQFGGRAVWLDASTKHNPAATNVHFTNGGRDPWYGLGIGKVPAGHEEKYGLSAFVIPTGSHCVDFRAPYEANLEAHEAIRGSLKRFLKGGDANAEENIRMLPLLRPNLHPPGNVTVGGWYSMVC